MINYKDVEHHPIVEELTTLLCNKVKNTQRSFFRIEVAYFLATMAASMRAYTESKDRGIIPINVYAILLNSSGSGKGFSISIMEKEVLHKFREKFIEDLMPRVASANIQNRGSAVALAQGLDPEEVITKFNNEYERAGIYTYAFDSGTTPAVKQMRHKLLLADIGALNIQVDEIASNLSGSLEVLTTYLELYDQGYIKPKLTKNTKENIRNTDLDGRTPANMLLFGTPIKLFNGGVLEDTFLSLMDTGYARRCLFALGDPSYKRHSNTDAKAIYMQAISGTNTATIDKLSNYFEDLATDTFYKHKVFIPDDVAIEILDYQITCEEMAAASKLSEMESTELSHRYFKTIKLAGALAFVDKASEMTLVHLAQAIKLVEESGEFFQQMLVRDKPHERLAKHIATAGTELTQADLIEALPFYNKTNVAKQDMMNLAIAWGYKNNVLIKRSITDGIEFYTGESLEETDTNKLIVSYSDQFGEGYELEEAPLDKLDQLLLAPGMNWCSHAFVGGIRQEKTVIPGFNLLVLDIDGTTDLNTTKSVLADYSYLIHTTKSHTDDIHRFRVVLPMSHVLKLDKDDYKSFMEGICSYLPLSTDTQAYQRSRKWNSYSKATLYRNTGELFDVLPFIPKTKQNEKYLSHVKSIGSITSLENWFINKINAGNRNNNLLKYALLLADNGNDLTTAISKIRELNTKIQYPLDNEEINKTILVTLRRRYGE